MVRTQGSGGGIAAPLNRSSKMIIEFQCMTGSSSEPARIQSQPDDALSAVQSIPPTSWPNSVFTCCWLRSLRGHPVANAASPPLEKKRKVQVKNAPLVPPKTPTAPIQDGNGQGRSKKRQISQNRSSTGNDAGDEPASCSDCHPGVLPPLQKPFMGDIRGCHWNAQALFTVNPVRESSKQGYANQLFNDKDFIGLVETHSNEGKVAAANLRRDCVTLWSHGTDAQAGISLWIKKEFLKNFNPITDDNWTTVVQGRVAKLALDGPNGALDIFVAYMTSGSDQTAKLERKQQIGLIKDHMRDKSEALTVLAGDFNFVSNKDDRISKSDGNSSGDRDKEESELFNRIFVDQHRLFELEQDNFTHACSQARSKIDRAYMNYSLCEQLDRNIECYVHPSTALSHHRALSFSKQACRRESKGRPAISSAVYRNPDFKRMVLIELNKLIEEDTVEYSAVRKLVLTKRAMHTVSEALTKRMELQKAESASEKVEWIMKFIRAAEKQSMKKMARCCVACPDILEFCHPDDPEARLREGFEKLKEKVITLARGEIMEDMEEVQKTECPQQQQRQKECVLKKLKKLIPGSSAELSAIQREDGSVTNEPAEMAEALRSHWQRVFKRKWMDRGILQEWFEDLQMSRGDEKEFRDGGGETSDDSEPEIETTQEDSPSPNDAPLTRTRTRKYKLSSDFADWKVRKKDIKKAIQCSNNSCPGPDAIPFGAWRAMGDIGIDILWEVYEVTEDEAAEAIFVAAYADEAETGQHNFNMSSLVCLPKEPTGEDPVKGAYYKPQSTRPLSIVDCDNRLVASAMRIRWEKQLRYFIRDRQQGFLKQRSMMRNLLEVDTAMLCSALASEKSATIFLDFEAAFPSITQEYTFEVLKNCGVPQQAMNSFKFCYQQSRCRIAMKGDTFEGFALEAGVRQGCPLSPLVYALVAEVLLDRLEQQVEGIFVRAYADDTALIVQDLEAATPKLENLFQEFECISGLRLNLTKSIIVPHNSLGESKNRRTFGCYATRWGQMQVAYKAKYLGYIMGPKKGDDSWNKPVEKLRKRTSLWQDLPAGLFWNCRIYNTFLHPILMFIAQLERPPKFAEDAAAAAMHKMAKGPGNWCCKEDLWNLKENFGQSASFHCLPWSCQAAKTRLVLKDRGISSLREFLADYDTIQKHWGNSEVIVSNFYAEWRSRSFIITLKENMDFVEKNIGSEEDVRQSRPHGGMQREDDKSWLKEVQKTYYQCIQALHIEDPIRRIRKKLERFVLDDARMHLYIPGSIKQRTPAWQARRTHCNLRSLKEIAPPRVQSAVFSTIWNRWTTERRMHQTSRHRCLLCRKGDTSDSIEHYAKCAFTRRLYATKLNMEPALFANMHAWTLCSPYIRSEEQLLGVGIAIYAVYTTTNRLRCHNQTHQLSQEDRYQMLAQSAKEAVKGHSRASCSLLQRWVNGYEDTLLSFGHDVWDAITFKKIKCVSNRRRSSKRHLYRWDDRESAVSSLQENPRKRRCLGKREGTAAGDGSADRADNDCPRFIGGNWLSISEVC